MKNENGIFLGIAIGVLAACALGGRKKPPSDERPCTIMRICCPPPKKPKKKPCEECYYRYVDNCR